MGFFFIWGQVFSEEGSVIFIFVVFVGILWETASFLVSSFESVLGFVSVKGSV